MIGTHQYNSEQLESGALRLTCPTCGRAIVVQWNPAYHKQVEEYGDPYVGHAWAMPGLKVEADASQA